MRRKRGFTYLTVLFMLAILMGGLALVGEVWETSAQREKEAELLHFGHQYRRAIAQYYESSPAGHKRYPRQLEDMLKDDRFLFNVRQLRKLHPDPVTGKEWGIVKAPDGGILGVHSLSEDRPLKMANFKTRDAGFDSAQKYSDWKFVHTPPPAAATTKPEAAKPAPGAPAAPAPARGDH